jgi:hypothetical protein
VRPEQSTPRRDSPPRRYLTPIHFGDLLHLHGVGGHVVVALGLPGKLDGVVVAGLHLVLPDAYPSAAVLLLVYLRPLGARVRLDPHRRRIVEALDLWPADVDGVVRPLRYLDLESRVLTIL